MMDDLKVSFLGYIILVQIQEKSPRIITTMTVTNDFIFEKDVEVAAGAMNSGGLGGGGLGGLSGMGGGMNRNSGAMGNSGPAGLQYSIPGILHFLQHEWARFEMERGQWEVEKAELQVC